MFLYQTTRWLFCKSSMVPVKLLPWMGFNLEVMVLLSLFFVSFCYFIAQVRLNKSNN